nr:efflux RND transporter periplasmic adaptor subunit [uncultured Desulfobulbus sp.]
MAPRPRPKRSLPTSLLVLTGSLALALGLWACKQEKAAPAASSQPPRVSVLEITPRDMPVSFTYVAQTQSSHLVNIQARVSGFLDRQLYTEGAVVKAGQVLFRLDAKPFQVQLDQAQAVLSKQAAALETSRKNLARTKPLVKQNALALKDLDDATGQFQSAAAGVEQAKAQVEAAKLDLSYTTITSPVTGVSSSARQTEGTYISPQNSLLTTVAVLDPIWVNFNISENEMQRYRDEIAKGLLIAPKNRDYAVQVILVDGSAFPHSGHMTFADPSYDPQTGTFLVRASVPNPDSVLRPNQYVRVRLTGSVRPRAILVPQRAVQQGAKGHFVWLIDTNDTIEQRPVVVGDWQGDNWFIAEGLSSGERVVVDGTLMLQPGMKVQVAPATAASHDKPVGQ